MSYEVRVEKLAQKILEALTDRKLRQRLERAILLLENDPRPAQAVKLKGASDYWRVRVGDCRIIYANEDARLLVLVITIGNRRDVYQ